jgi:malate dehydrogenase (oxaloacetate-decarboxylating)
MNHKSHKKAVKHYAKSDGNFMTGLGMPLKKEADLSLFYYPGIDGVLEKIQANPELQKKYCVHHKTIGLISTRPVSYYPLLTARAALLSHVAGVNVIPLLLRYDNVKNLPHQLEQLSLNFQMMIGADLKPIEKEIVRAAYKDKEYPFYYTEQLQAAAVVSALHSGAKMLKKSLKKAKITLEGDDDIMEEILMLLKAEEAEAITLLDEKGPLYEKRPNMNKNKNRLSKMMGLKKDTRTREEVLEDTDLYITATREDVGSSVTNHLPDKAVIVSLKSSHVTKKAKQSLVSTLPEHSNHITDLHIAVGLASALKEGKKIKNKTLSEAMKGLHSVFKTPKQHQLMPGLLEKKLAQKISKHIK